MLDIASVVVAPEGAAEGGFSAVFQGQLESVDMAKGGNGLPKGGDIALQSRQLLGGTKIKVSGFEPSEEGLAEFALSQGMDPRAVMMLGNSDNAMHPTVGLDKLHVATRPVLDGGKASAIAAQITQAAASVTSGIVGTAIEAHALIDLVNNKPAAAYDQTGNVGPQLQLQQPSLDTQVVREAAIAPAQASGPGTEALVSAHAVLANGELGRAMQHLEPASSMALSNMVKGHVPILSVYTAGELAGQISTNKPSTDASITQGAALNPASFDLEKIAPRRFLGTIDASLSDLSKGEADSLRPTEAKGPEIIKFAASQLQVSQVRGADVAPLSQLAAQPMTAEQTITAAQTRLEERRIVGKIVMPKADEAVLKRLASNRQQTEVVKMASINLAPGIADQASVMLTAVSPTPVGAAFVAGQVVVDVSATAPQNAQGTAVSTDTSQDDPAREMLRRQDEHHQLSQRLAQVLGQRLSAQIERGSWRVEMDLHPSSMGRVEVQLEMKNGELEANFLSANAATRELLNDSLPRLREMFEQFGTNSAYLGLGSSNQGQSDGNSPSEQSGSDGNGSGDETLATQDKVRKPVSDDGLDVLV
ncbi:MAG: flagellar hook-length control protein FliK [Porticoccaceae bacterium]|nr:flagellar hook-length control protein FliK [Porticoccaceae bacterium]